MTDDLSAPLTGQQMCFVAEALGWSSQGAICAQPWLIKKGYMTQTARGWMLTAEAMAALAAR